MLHENMIEFYSEDETATLSLHRRRFVNRIKKLKKARPDECDYVENADGTICAHVPLSWIKVSPPRRLSDEQRGELAARLSGTAQPQGEIETDFES